MDLSWENKAHLNLIQEVAHGPGQMNGTKLGYPGILDNTSLDQYAQIVSITNFNFVEEYCAESEEIDIEQIRASQLFRKKRYVDALYFGDCINKIRNGKGVMKYKSGRVFEGDWVQDLRHGRGYERYENWNIYLGQFHTGKAHGQGNYSWKATGEVYDGEWVRGIRQGYGIWRSVKGDSYMGEWKNGKACGYGVFSWSNGDKYEGEWGNNVKHGKGADYFNNGDNYRGDYKSGKPDGHGVYTWANGSSYEGNFKNGLKYGKGTWKKAAEQPGAQRNEYIGEYVDDKKCGQGEFKWASGNSYKGGYRDDERDGWGTMTWTDGSQYIGEWVKGIQHGKGKMIFPDGTIKEGYFESNVYVGTQAPSRPVQQFKTPLKVQSSFLKQTEQQLNNKRLAEIQKNDRQMYNRTPNNSGSISDIHSQFKDSKGQSQQPININNQNKIDFHKANSNPINNNYYNFDAEQSASQAKLIMNKRLENQSSTQKLKRLSDINNLGNSSSGGKQDFYDKESSQLNRTGSTLIQVMNNSSNNKDKLYGKNRNHDVKLEKINSSPSFMNMNDKNYSNKGGQTNYGGFHSPEKLKRQAVAGSNQSIFQNNQLFQPQNSLSQQKMNSYPSILNKQQSSPSEVLMNHHIKQNREQSQNILKNIQKPKLDKINLQMQPLRIIELNHDSPGEQTDQAILYKELVSERQQNQVQHDLLELDCAMPRKKIKRKKEGKYLATSKKGKNCQSHKILPKGNLSGTRFFDSSDYNMSSNYNLSLS